MRLPALRRSTHWPAEDRCRAPRWKRLVLRLISWARALWRAATRGKKRTISTSSHIPQTTYTPSAGPGRNYSLRNCPLPHAREKPQNYAQKAPKERDFKIFLASGGAAQAAGAMARPILVFTIHHVFAAPFQIRSRWGAYCVGCMVIIGCLTVSS